MQFWPIGLEGETQPAKHLQGADKKKHRGNKNKGWHHFRPFPAAKRAGARGEIVAEIGKIGRD
jgi:hypothetical protein